MKILQIFGAVVAVHLLAFIFIFASPGCQSSPRNVPTPDATVPTGSGGPAVTYDANNANPPPVDLGTPVVTYAPAAGYGRAVPTRPGSPAAAAVTPARSVENVAPVSTYTVGKGDSLWSIAKKNHLSVSELAKANNIGTGAALQPGKKLIIPGKVAPAAPKDTAAILPAGKSGAAASDKAAATHSGADAVKHTVQAGETLGGIAKKYQVSTGELAAVNNLTGPIIRIGQQLIIPGLKAGGAKTVPNGTATAKAPTTAKPTAATKPASNPPANDIPTVVTPAAPHFDITPPPPGQDLDAGLKEPSTEVPTIKVEEPKVEQPPKN